MDWARLLQMVPVAGKQGHIVALGSELVREGRTVTRPYSHNDANRLAHQKALLVLFLAVSALPYVSLRAAAAFFPAVSFSVLSITFRRLPSGVCSGQM